MMMFSARRALSAGGTGAGETGRGSQGALSGVVAWAAAGEWVGDQTCL